MKCADIHLRLGAEPGVADAELEAHLRECPACAQYRREMIQLDEKIRRALEIDVMVTREGGARRAEPSRSIVRQWALAASVLGVVALSLLELFVAFLQAFIFTFLTALFLGSALHPEH